MIKLSRLLAFALVCFACSLAFADAGGASADPYALYYPLIATGLGSLGAFVRGYTPATGFWHTWYGHMVLVLIGAVAGSLTPIFEAGHVTKIALISGLVGGGVAFLSALKPTGKSSAVGLATLLPMLFIFGSASGCHGYKAPTYATMTAMAGGAGVAAENLPKICEGREAAEVDSSKTKDEATQRAGAVHAQCVTAAAVLKSMPDGLQAARDAVYNAPEGADLTAVLPWVKLAVKEYCDARPLLDGLGYQLPTFPGVC